MNIRLLLLFFVFHTYLYAQKSTREVTNESKWIKAVVNLEVRMDLIFSDEFKALEEKAKRGEISNDSLQKVEISLRLNSPSYSGTAIYLSNNNRHYLITARHVVEQNVSPLHLTRTKYHDYREFPMNILIIDNYSLTEGDKTRDMVTDLEGLGFIGRSYVFSDSATDLAVVNIDGDGYVDKNFDKDSIIRSFTLNTTLKNRGYEPIEMKDIDTLCHLLSDQKISSFGFTQDYVDFIGNRRRTLDTLHFLSESTLLTVPFASNGTIERSDENDNFFTGNIFVFHGDSGGPIVSNNKLVGIVSGPAPDLKKVAGTNLSYLQRHTRFIKASNISSLLRELDLKLDASEKAYKEASERAKHN